MHLPITEKPTRGCIYILDILPTFSEENIVTENAKNCRYRQLHCHLMAHPPRNPGMYLIFLETNHWPVFSLLQIVWVYLLFT